MPTPPRKVTLRDIAREAGCTSAAVSMALRNRSNISLTRRKEIAAIAARMGYHPDPLVTRLMTQVRRRKVDSELLPIAWINCSRHAGFWSDFNYHRPVLEGARRRAEQLGYRLDTFHWFDPEVPPKRLGEILYHRAVQGVIFAGSEKVVDPTFAYDHFCAVQMLPRQGEPLHLPEIAPDHRGNYVLARNHLAALGCRRIGFVLSDGQEQYAHFGPSASHLRMNQAVRSTDRIPFFVYEALALSNLNTIGPDHPTILPKLLDYIKKYRVDALICQHKAIFFALQANGFRIPSDISIAHLSLAEDVADWSGIDPQLEAQGEAAINTLTALINRNETGLQDIFQTLLIRGKWRAGKTTR